jgi:hypothetical protein
MQVQNYYACNEFSFEKYSKLSLLKRLIFQWFSKALDPEKLKEMDELIARVYADYDPLMDPTLQRQPPMMPIDPSAPMSKLSILLAMRY